MSTISILIILSLVVAIILGFIQKVNTGLYAIAFAFIIGIFVMEKSANNIIALWPTRLFFQMFCITFFYGFQRQNGSLEALAKRIVYASRKVPYLIPLALLLACAIVAGLGPGTLVSLLILPPIIMSISELSNIKPIYAVILFTSGIDLGAWSPITVNASLIRTLLETAGYTAAQANALINPIWFNVAVAKFLVALIGYFVFKGYKATAEGLEKPEPLTRQQKTTLLIIAAFVLCLVLPSIIHLLTGSPFFGRLRNQIDITYLAILLSILCIVLKLGDEKKSIALVPWPTIIMICGVGTLIAVATEAGAVQELSDLLSTNISTGVIPYFILLIAGFMSFFSSTTGVVLPTMFPICTNIVVATGISASTLLSLVVIGSTTTGLSPFSTGGAMGLVALGDDEKAKQKVFYGLFGVIGAAMVMMFILLAIGLVV